MFTAISSRATPRRVILSSLGLLSIGLYTTNTQFHDSVNHTCSTIKRVNVISIATIKCFYQYKKTLFLNQYLEEKDQIIQLNKCHLKSAKITLKALEKNGGIYIKLGQHISAMTYLLPKEWTDTMTSLQDKCPNSTFEEIDQMFKDDLNISIDEKFQSFNKNPIGTASLAQVHIANLNGQDVAVKCQHPSLKEFIPLDIFLTQTVFNLLNKVFPEYPLVWLGEELQDSIYVELDFNNEAKNAINTQNYFKNFQSLTALRIPNIISSNRRILIMEYIPGERLDNLKFLNDNHISRSEVSSCLSHIFNNMIFTPDVGIHCDPHGGNLAIRKNPKGKPFNFEIILYDHGLYRQVPKLMRYNYAKFWLALLNKNPEEMEIYAEKFAGINKDEFPIFAAAITGRDIKTALNYDISKERNDDEISNMKTLLTSENLLIKLMKILSHIPKVVLLILKTNDLTRNLDENLKNPLGPERTFLIMTRYCSKTVYDEETEEILNSNSKFKYFHLLKSWLNYNKNWTKLIIYDFTLFLKNWFNYLL